MPIIKSSTPASQAVNNANKVIQVAQLLAQASTLASEITSANSVLPMQNGWNVLNTAPLNADGTISTTQDTTPNSANPINANVYSTLLGAYTSAQLGQFLSLAVSFQQFASGSSVQNGLAPSLLVEASS